MKRNHKKSIIWEGVYQTYEEAKAKGNAFSGDRWLDRIRAQIIDYRKESDSCKLAMPPRMSDLPLLCSILEPESILDFGGSSGWVFDFIKNSLKLSSIKKYTIIEIEEVVSFMQSLKIHESPVIYETNFSEEKADILYTNSTLQYIYNDAYFLDLISRCSPSHILIEDFMGGNFEDFFSLQNYYEYSIPLKFRNREKFVNSIIKEGYELSLSKPYYAEILGTIGTLPMDNFPEDRQIQYAETMLFRRK